MAKRRIVDLSVDEIAKLAREAGLKAVKETLEAGLPVTGVENGKIVKLYPDGRKEIIGQIKQDLPY